MKGPNELSFITEEFLAKSGSTKCKNSILSDAFDRKNMNCNVPEFWYTVVHNNHKFFERWKQQQYN
jgi:hypothetical protein